MKNFLRFFTLCGLATCVLNAGSAPAMAHENHRAPAKAAKPRVYRNVRGQVIEIIKPARRGEPTAVVLDHENIPNFMGAMRMAFPLRNAADAKKLKKGAKIRFDILLSDGMALANIKMLPPQTKLKLAPKH